MTMTFERGFADAERSAVAAAKAGSAIASAAKQLQKAAQEGDIAKLRKAAEKLSAVTENARQDVANARTAWPFTEQQEKEYLAASYEAELIAEAGQAGLTIHSRDARLVAVPSILQILPGELSVRIDRKKNMAVRPSHVVQTLLSNQRRKARYPSENFLEALCKAYKLILGGNGVGSVILLTQVYQAFTLQPRADVEYGKSEFARDIFMLDSSGITRTRSGLRLSFHGSTAIKGGGTNVFTFVAPDGNVVKYYGVRFSEE